MSPFGGALDLVPCLGRLTVHLETGSGSGRLSRFEQLLIKALLSPLNTGGGRLTFGYLMRVFFRRCQRQ